MCKTQIPSTQSPGASVSPSSSGNAEFSTTPNAFYCCQCGHGPWLCALYPACVECGHHFNASCCTPAYTSGELFSSAFSLSSTVSGQQLTCSDPSKATTNSSSLYNDVCSLSANASSEDLTAPNSRIPPPVAHNTSSLDPFNANTGSSLGEANPISAPPADGDEVWYCCSCTTGPYLVALYPACTACHHSRCYYCKIDG